MKFINIGQDEYVIASDALMILENTKGGAAKYLKSQAIKEEKLYKLGLRTIGNTLLVMKDMTVYEISIPVAETLNRFKSMGYFFVQVSQSSYVAFDDIDVFASTNSVFAVRLKEKTKNTDRDDYYLIRQGEKTKTFIRTSTGMLLRTAMSVEELKNEIVLVEMKKNGFLNE